MNSTTVRFVLVALIVCVSSGCAVRPPSNLDDICSIFGEKRLWYRAAHQSQKIHGIPISIMMAIVYQESRFRAHARPARSKLLWIFPGARPSDAYGYAQAIQGTWNDYKKSTGKQLVSRSSFVDAVDFIGWYNERSIMRLGILPSDARNLYLAYHEGWSGYEKRSWEDKEWLLPVADKVQRRADLYQGQLETCERRLRGSWLSRILLFPFRLLLLPLRTAF